MVILALGTGMRASEVLGLDREHVDLKRGVAILPDTKNDEHRIVQLPLEVITSHKPLNLLKEKRMSHELRLQNY